MGADKFGKAKKKKRSDQQKKNKWRKEKIKEESRERSKLIQRPSSY